MSLENSQQQTKKSKTNIFKIRTFKILTIKQTGIIIDSLSQIEQYEFSDVIKIYPTDKNSIMISVSGRHLEEEYQIQNPIPLIESYLYAVDYFILEQRSETESLKNIKKNFFNSQLGFKLNSFSENMWYKVNFEILRSVIRVTLIDREGDDINFYEGNKLFPEKKSKNQFTIGISAVKKFILENFGFHILLNDSETVYSFICYDFDKVTTIIEDVRKKKNNFLGQNIEVESNPVNSPINAEVDKASLNNFFRMFNAIKQTKFDDSFCVCLGMNDSYLYELTQSKEIIINKISVQHVYKVTLCKQITRKIILYFLNGDTVEYLLDSIDCNSFLSQLIGIVNEKKALLESKNDLSPTLLMGTIDFRVNYIWGLYSEYDFKQKIETERLERLMTPGYLYPIPEYGIDQNFSSIQIKKDIEIVNKDNLNKGQMDLIEEIILNYDFKGKLKNVNFKNMITRFKIFLKVVLHNQKILAVNREGDDSQISLLFNPDKFNKQDLSEKILNSEEKSYKNSIYKIFGKNWKIIEDQIKNIIEIDGSELNSILNEEQLCTRLWQLITLTMNNEEIFKEIGIIFSTINEESDEYLQFLERALQVFLNEESFVTSYAVGGFLKAMIDFYQPNQKKFETLNKNVLINPRKRFDFFKYLTDFFSNILQFSEKENKQFISQRVFQIEATLTIFESIIFRKKSSTLEKDLERTLDLLRSPLYFQILVQMNLSKDPEVLYRASLVINSIIECFGDKDKVKDYQKRIVLNSTLLLRHLEFCISILSVKQKQNSILFIFHCLIENPFACALVARLIPRPLFTAVQENLKDLSKWNLTQWEDLVKNLNWDFSTATIQWNKECRDELLRILKTETNDFYSHFENFSLILLQTTISEMFSSSDFSVSPEREQQILQLRWNFEEYEVTHQALKKKLPIFRYYIDELLKDEPNPHFSIEKITNPRKFWDELSTAFIASNNNMIKEKYLKCMILLYRKYDINIKDSNLIGYLMKVPSNPSDSLIYLHLQLLFTFLSVEDKILQTVNSKLFLESNGLQYILGVMQNNLIVDDLNAIDYFALEKSILKSDLKNKEVQILQNESDNKIRSASKERKDSKISIQSENITFVFCKNKLQREALTAPIRKCNELIISIQIFKACITKTKSQFQEKLRLFPKPMARKIASETETIDTIQRLLLVKDDYLMKEVLEFVNTTYLDKFNYALFSKNKWVYPLLISRISTITCMPIANFFKEVLRNVIANWKTTPNPFEDLINFNINSSICSLAVQNKNNKDVLENDPVLAAAFAEYPGLFYIPSYFWHILMQKGPEEFIKLLLTEDFESPFLVWNKGAIDQLKLKLAESNKVLYENFKFPSEFNYKIVHYSFAEETTIGPIILRNWVLIDNLGEGLSVENVSNFQKFSKNVAESLSSLLLKLKATKPTVANLKDLNLFLEVLTKLFKTFPILAGGLYYAISNFLKIYLENTDKLQKKQAFLLEFALKNALKLLKNTLNKNAVCENHAEFWKCVDLRLNLLRVFQRPIKNLIDNNASLTYVNLKINNFFLGLLKNLFSYQNKFTFIPFSDGTQNLYDIEHILTSFDIGFIKILLNFLNKFDIAISDQQNDRVSKIILSQEKCNETKVKISEDKVNEKQNTELKPDVKSLFKKQKSTFVVSSGITETIPQKKDNNKVSMELDNLFKEADINVTSNQILTPRNLVDIKIESLVEIEDKTIKVNENFEIKMGESTKVIPFNLLLKTLNYEKLVQQLSPIDLISTKLNEFVNEPPRSERISRVFLDNFKKILVNIMKNWGSLIYSLSMKTRNLEKIISSGLAFRAISLCFLQERSYINNLSDRILAKHIDIFFEICFKAFRETFLICSRFVQKVSKEESVMILKYVSNTQVEKEIFNEKEITGVQNKDIMLNFFHNCISFFSAPFMFKILILSAPDFMKELNYDIKQIDLFIPKKIHKEFYDAITIQILNNLLLYSTDFKELSSFNISEVIGEPLIHGIYINCYIEQPVPLQTPEAFIPEILLLLKSSKKSQLFETFINFLSCLTEMNSSKLKFDPGFYDDFLPLLTGTMTEQTFNESTKKKICKFAFSFFINRVTLNEIEFQIAFESVKLWRFIFSSFLIFQKSKNVPQEFFTFAKILIEKDSKIKRISGVKFYSEILLSTILEEWVQIKVSIDDFLNVFFLIPKQKQFSQFIKISNLVCKRGLIEVLWGNDTIHPLLIFNQTKKKLLKEKVLNQIEKNQSELFQKELIDKINIEYDIEFLFDIKTNPSFLVDSINIGLFLQSKDNSFIHQNTNFILSLIEYLNQKIQTIIDIVQGKFDENQFNNAQLALKISASVLGVLLFSESQKISNQNLIESLLENIYNYYKILIFHSNGNQNIKNQALNDKKLDDEEINILLWQIIFGLERFTVELKPNTFNLFFQTLEYRYNKQIGRFSLLITLEAIMKFIQKLKSSFFLSQIDSKEFIKILIKLNIQLTSNTFTLIINTIFSILINEECLQKQILDFLKEKITDNYFQIISISANDIMANLVNHNVIDNFDNSNQVSQLIEEKTYLSSLQKFPFVFSINIKI